MFIRVVQRCNTTILCNQQIFQLLVNLKAFCVVVLSGQRIDQAVVLAVAIEAVGIINACLHDVQEIQRIVVIAEPSAYKDIVVLVIALVCKHLVIANGVQLYLYAQILGNGLLQVLSLELILGSRTLGQQCNGDVFRFVGDTKLIKAFLEQCFLTCLHLLHTAHIPLSWSPTPACGRKFRRA